MVFVAMAYAQEAPLPEVAPPVVVAVVPPSLTAPLALTWPPSADMEAGEVTVVLRLVVAEDGSVTEASVVTGAAPFALAALTMARGLRLTPATEGGVAIAVEIPLAITYVPPPINVSGVVRLTGGKSLPASGLVLRVGDRTALTDGEGRFHLRGVAVGTYPLVLADPTFRLGTRTITVTEGAAVDLALWAAPDTLDLGIVATYRKNRDEITTHSLTAEQIRTTPGTLGDPLRAIQDLPGSVRTPLDAGWLLVRGGDPRDTGVYIDGIRVPLVYHLGGFTSVIHPAFIERVEFFPGGQSARYGRATAGVVDLVTRGDSDKFEVRAGANLIFAGAYAHVPFRNGAVSAAVRRSYLDAILVPIVGQAGSDAAPRFWDWQVRADYGPAHIFGLGYVDEIHASDALGSGLTVSIATQRIHGAIDADVGGKVLAFRPYFGWEKRSLDIQELATSDSRESVGGGLRVEVPDDGAGALGWSGGIDADGFNYALVVNNSAREALVGSPDVYADVRYGARVQGILGVRVDTLFVEDQLARAALSPRFSGRAAINNWLSVVADAGMYHQPPPYDLLIGPPDGSTLELEESYGGGGGVRLTWGRLHVDVDGYGRAIENLTGFELDGSLGQGQGLAYGVETMTRGEVGRFTGWITYAYSRSLRRETNDLWRASAYDQPHTLVAVGAFDLGRNWTVASRFRYASGFFVSEAGDPIEALDVLNSETELVDSDIEGRTDPFHALDVKVSKRFLFHHWRLEAFLDVQNAYNRRVAEPVISGLSDAYISRPWGFGLPVLPIIGFEGVIGG